MNVEDGINEEVGQSFFITSKIRGGGQNIFYYMKKFVEEKNK
jgi:hypothetical protein